MTNPFGSNPIVSVGADPSGTAGADIDAGSFWPAVSTTAFRTAMRVDGTVIESRVRAALIEASITVIEQLSEWQIEQVTKGATSLDETSTYKVDGVCINRHRWLRAVYCLAAADIAERYRGEDTTGTGNQKADLVESPIGDLRRNAFHAVQDILGKPRTVVELI